MCFQRIMSVKMKRKSFIFGVIAGVFLVGANLAIAPVSAQAPLFGMRRSLGGYGAAALPSAYGQRGGPLIPYAGGQGGFIPYQDLETRQTAEAAMMQPRRIAVTPIGGAGRMGPPIGGASRMTGPRIYIPFGGRGGMGLGRGVVSRRSAPVGRGAMSPGLGSPFRRPPNLIGSGM